MELGRCDRANWPDGSHGYRHYRVHWADRSRWLNGCDRADGRYRRHGNNWLNGPYRSGWLGGRYRTDGCHGNRRYWPHWSDRGDRPHRRDRNRIDGRYRADRPYGIDRLRVNRTNRTDRANGRWRGGQ